MKISVKIFVWILFAVFLISGHSCTTYHPIGRQSREFGRQSGSASLQVFYDALSPYGEWVHNRQYGYVWIPDAGRNFFPYASNGRWIFTEYGWTWFSDYEWGWAPFHYGRWDYDPAYGWFWFPGDQWGPAWVTWRMGNGYYGWSPMRPETEFGFNYRNDDVYSWVFVQDHDFGKRNLSRYYVSSRRNDDILRRTEVVRNNRTDNTRNVVYSSGPDPSEVRRITGRKIQSVTVTDLDRPGRRLNGNKLELYRPRVETASGQRPAPSRISDVKDIRPMRERDRNYRPEPQGQVNGMGEQQGSGQERPATDREQLPSTREREATRQREEKQAEMQRRRQETLDQHEQRQLENSGQQQDPDREYRQTRQERQRITEQQKKAMQKERQREEKATSDSSRTKRVQSRSIRQNSRR